jgi:hypothetical protein
MGYLLHSESIAVLWLLTAATRLQALYAWRALTLTIVESPGSGHPENVACARGR